MTGILGRPYLTRQDLVVGVGRSQEIGIRWARADDVQGSNKAYMDLSNYVGIVRLESLSGDGWLEFAPSLDADGLCLIALDADMTGGPEWLGRTIGAWSVTVTAPDGTATCLAAGYLTLVTTGGI